MVGTTMSNNRNACGMPSSDKTSGSALSRNQPNKNKSAKRRLKIRNPESGIQCRTLAAGFWFLVSGFSSEDGNGAQDNSDEEQNAYRRAAGRGGFDAGAVIRLMLDRLDVALSLDSLAELAGYSRYHFCRAFRERTGYPPMEYFARLKIQRACELLETTAQSGREISEALGYATPSTSRPSSSGSRASRPRSTGTCTWSEPPTSPLWRRTLAPNARAPASLANAR